jgi:CelD/BcsL family acetyltransferase involved in cellulose biosynthesis
MTRALPSENVLTTQSIDPRNDSRWGEFVANSRRASVFHSTAWIETLHRTYGYKPIAITTSAAGDTKLENALLFCRIDSWLTGRRLVSLPFSDHCDPLVENPLEWSALVAAAERMLQEQRLGYLEVRLKCELPDELRKRSSCFTYYHHALDLTPGADALFRKFQKDSIQRKILRAQRDGVVCDAGRSAKHLDEFFRLQIMTRRRHGLPPQPRGWFQNLVESFGDASKIWIARHEGEAIAGIFTLRHKKAITFKYGASDERFHKFGGVPFLFWQMIQEACADHLEMLDLGRTETDNEGLVTFKDRWGTTRTELTYARVLASPRSSGAYGSAEDGWHARAAKRVAAHLPDQILCSIGSALYKHIG